MRLASYSQQSQRYCKVSQYNPGWYITPKSIHDKEESSEKYHNLMIEIEKVYNNLILDGIPLEDARMVLPNACSTEILMSMNARAFIEQAQKRLCHRAQWEIRELYTQMRRAIFYYGDPEDRIITQLAVPKCVTGKCPELRSCGTPWSEANDG